MEKRINELLIGLIGIMILYSCASQGNLYGGDKDETPPEVLGISPKNESLGVNPKSISFEFDENIKLDNLQKNLLVSPLLKEKPTIIERNKGFTLVLNEELEPNTTYSFNFGNAVKDLNEGNAIEGFTYVFSTGEAIDQGKLNGKVYDAKTNGPLEKTENKWAILYKDPVDSTVQTTRPNYIAAIKKEDGSFLFQNVADGTYKVYVIEDNNFNYYYDLINEKIAFSEKTYTIKNGEAIAIDEPFYLFEAIDKKARVTKFKRNRNNSYSIHTNQAIENYSFTDSLNAYSTYPKEIYSDSIVFWLNKESQKNKLYTEFNGEKIDTLSIAPFKEKQLDTLFKIKLRNANDFRFTEPIYIEANQPFQKNYRKDSITLLEDSLYLAGVVELKLDSLNHRKMNVLYDWQPGKTYQLTFNKETFTSYYDFQSDSLGVEFTTPKLESLGKLIMELPESKGHQVIIQLLKDGKLLEEKIITNERSIEFTQLRAGDYNFKVILDENNNGKWDTGNYEEQLQPEKIIEYIDKVNVRSNWDMEVVLEY